MRAGSERSPNDTAPLLRHGRSVLNAGWGKRYNHGTWQPVNVAYNGVMSNSEVRTLLKTDMVADDRRGLLAIGSAIGFGENMRHGPPFALGVYPFTLGGSFVGFIIGLAWDDYHRTAPPQYRKAL